MCVIFACYTGLPTEDQLFDAEIRNRDGVGVSFPVTNGVRWEKGLFGKDVVKMIKEGTLVPPCLIHFRSASAGGVDPSLTHPFPISEKVPLALRGETQRVLMHNGHWGSWDRQTQDIVVKSRKRFPGGKWSDSRALTWLVANFGDGILDLVEHLRPDRIAVLARDGISLWGDWKDPAGKDFKKEEWEKSGKPHPPWLASNDHWMRLVLKGGTDFNNPSSFRGGSGGYPSAVPHVAGAHSPIMHYFDDNTAVWTNKDPRKPWLTTPAASRNTSLQAAADRIAEKTKVLAPVPSVPKGETPTSKALRAAVDGVSAAEELLSDERFEGHAC